MSRKQLSVNFCVHVHGYKMMRLESRFNGDGKLNLKTGWHSKKKYNYMVKDEGENLEMCTK